MWTPRLRKRVPSVDPVSGAVLKHHRLTWHKQGVDGSAKCDIVGVDVEDGVYGVLFEMDAGERDRLDRAEQLGTGYDMKTVEIEVGVGAGRDTVTAFTYYALMKDAALVPYRWYKELVVAGAREHGLPGDYIDRLKRVKATEDSDRRRVLKAERLLH